MDGSFDDQNTLDLLNEIFTWIFIVEMALKLVAFSPVGYVKDKMNIFDGCIVILSVVEMTVLSGN